MAATRSARASAVPARASRSPTSWTRSSVAAPPAAAPSPAGRARVRVAARTPSSGSTSTLAEAAFGVTRELKVDTALRCEACAGRGHRSRHVADHLRDLPRRGRGRRGAALVPRRDPHPAPLRGVPRLRLDHPRPVPRVLGRRSRPLAPHADREDPRRASTTAPASSSPHRARSAPAADLPATSTSRSTSSRTRRSPATATTSTRPSRCR